jgi:adenylate cyclase
MAAASGTVAVEVVRLLAVDRRRRRVERAFSHYLAPSIVERLVEDASALRRGGESRDISMFFGDGTGFTPCPASSSRKR